MSWQEAVEPICNASAGAIELVVEPKIKDLGGFTVRRVLPAPERRLVGPFIFVDQMGPADFEPGRGIDVRPHPHIGISTVTYLFEGEILHRDSLGFEQPIRPGAVNLMTAGRGIVHSERTAPALLASGQRLHGMQTWMALPDGHEEVEPAFVHYPANDLPVVAIGDVQVTIIIGGAFDHESPVTTLTETLYLDLAMPAGSSLTLPRLAEEQALYVADGEVDAAGVALRSGTMGVLAPAAGVELSASLGARVLVYGGAPVGPREIWWNFVSSSKARIEQAKDDWRAMRFGTVAGDADEFIPLPES